MAGARDGPTRTALEASANEIVVRLPDARPTPLRKPHTDFLATRDERDDPEGD